MKSIAEKIVLWINKRFIFLVEVAGYGISLILGLGAIYSLFTYDDVYAHANGSLIPTSESLTITQKCVIYNWAIESGDKVEEGTPVARIVTDETSFQRLLATQHLANAIISLNQAGNSSVRELNILRNVLEDIDEIPPIQTIHSPGRGIIIVSMESELHEELVPGRTLATVYNLNSLLCAAVLESEKTDKVEEGQVVRLTVPELEETIVGQVVGQPEHKDGETIQFQFDKVSNNVQQFFRDLVISEPISFPEVRASVVVGRRSLFAKLFGRSF